MKDKNSKAANIKKRITLIAALALIAFGAVAYLEQMMRQPEDCPPTSTHALAERWRRGKCLPPILSADEKTLLPHKSATLPNIGCHVIYGEVGNTDQFEFAVRIISGNARVYWAARDSDEWQEITEWHDIVVEGDETRVGGDARAGLPLIEGSGILEFEVRNHRGADKFEIDEDWKARYIIDLMC